MLTDTNPYLMFSLLYTMRPYDDDTEPPGEPPPEGTLRRNQLEQYLS